VDIPPTITIATNRGDLGDLRAADFRPSPACSLVPGSASIDFRETRREFAGDVDIDADSSRSIGGSKLPGKCFILTGKKFENFL
jgi:hypothetical protein